MRNLSQIGACFTKQQKNVHKCKNVLQNVTQTEVLKIKNSISINNTKIEQNWRYNRP